MLLHCYRFVLFFTSFVCGFAPFDISSQRKEKQFHALFTKQRINTNTVDVQKIDFDNECLDRRQMFMRAAICLSTSSVFPKVVSASENKQIVNNLTTFTCATTEVPTSFDESISGFLAGALLAATKTLVKFPLDTVTVRVQMPDYAYSLRDPFDILYGCYNGVSLTLLSNIPAGAVFFAVKDAVKTSIINSRTSTMPKWQSTSLAVAAAQIPYWLVRNPSEVVKVRQQANIDGYGEGVSPIDAVRLTLKNNNEEDNDWNGISELYTGYWENILYAYPADVIKFVAYEKLTKGRKNLSPLEGAKAGALATAVAQFLTTPLDVVRNRLMTGRGKNGIASTLSEDKTKKSYIRTLIDLGKDEGLNGLFAGSIPRVGKAFLSGSIQFATYEESKQSVLNILQKRSK